MFGVVTQSPHHSGYSPGWRTTVFPGHDRVIDDSGSIYRTQDLTEAGSLGGVFVDIGFTDAGEVVALRNPSLIEGFTAALSDIGVLTLTRPARSIHVSGSDVVAFSQPAGAGTSIARERVSLSGLAPGPAHPRVEPTNLAYTPDGVWLDRDGVLLLFSRLHRNIFRWSVAEQRYLESIPLSGTPNHVDYSRDLHALILGHVDNQTRILPLDSPLLERAIARGRTQVDHVLAAGNHVFLVQPAGSWQELLSYDLQGTLKSRKEVYSSSRSYVWDPSRRRVYREGHWDSHLGYTEIEPDGTFGDSGESPDHQSTEKRLPIRVSPDGDVILNGGGSFHNADTLARNNTLPHALDDATWLGRSLFTGRSVLQGAEIQRWGGSNYGLDASVMLGGRLVRLFAVNDDLALAVTLKEDHVQFTLLDLDLNVQNHFPGAGTAAGRLINLSTRADIGTGEDIMIAGFVVNGSTPKAMLLRGIGPALSDHNVTGALDDPILRIFDAGQNLIAENDDWEDTDAAALASTFSAVSAFALPEGNKDSAVLLTLAPGLYTAHLAGNAGGTGVGLIEVYDLDTRETGPRLVNISSRAVVGTGARVLIPGLVIEGTTPKRILFRAIGPTLGTLGVAGVLADPVLEILDRHGSLIAGNDDWSSGNVATIKAAESAAQAFALEPGSKDAALVFTLPPGLYTVRVSGANGGTGVALVEAYEIP